jgi:hypothetical protein
MTAFLGMITLANGYYSRTQTVALCELPDGRLICVAPFGFWTWIGSEVLA